MSVLDRFISANVNLLALLHAADEDEASLRVLTDYLMDQGVSPDEAVAVQDSLQELIQWDQFEPYILWLDNVYGQITPEVLAESREAFTDSYAGHYNSELEWAYQFVDDVYDLQNMMGNLAGYFDYESFARDVFMSDMYSMPASDGGIYAFNNH